MLQNAKNRKNNKRRERNKIITVKTKRSDYGFAL